jgi:hypothetical protein
MSDFIYGDELEEQANQEIKTALIDIKNSLSKGYPNLKESCPRICAYLCANPELISEFSELWQLCGQCNNA